MDFEALADLALAARGITPADPNYARYKAAFVQQAQNESSVQGRWFAEDTRRYDSTLANQQAQVENQARQIENQYRIAKLGVRNDQERLALDRWKSEQDARLAQARLDLDTELGRGRLDIDRGAQGLDLLRTTVDLNSQVRNWAKALDWRRGVAANPNAPMFLRSMLQNASASSGSLVPSAAQPVGLPEQNSLAAVLGDLGMQTQQQQPAAAVTPGAGVQQAAAAVEKDPRDAAYQAAVKAYTPSSTEGYDTKDIAALKTIASLAAQGTAKTANRVGMLDQDEQQFLAGGMDRLGIGGDWWLRQSDAQRVGQSSARLA